MAVGRYMHDPSTESAAWIWAHPVHDSNARSFAVSSGRAPSVAGKCLLLPAKSTRPFASQAVHPK